jgi:hypothetical protein
LGAATVASLVLVDAVLLDVVVVLVVAAEVVLLVELLPHAVSTARLATTVTAPRQRRFHVFMPLRVSVRADNTPYGS